MQGTHQNVLASQSPTIDKEDGNFALSAYSRRTLKSFTQYFYFNVYTVIVGGILIMLVVTRKLFHFSLHLRELH